MNFFIDTEFNGYKGDLISIGIVDECDNRWYAVLPCGNPVPWVAEHVMPVLFELPMISVASVQRGLERFLSRYETIHIIADWPEDIQHFCDLLITGPGERLDTPPLTMEVRRDLNCDKSKIPHNALSDAIALRDAWYAIFWGQNG